VPILNPAASSAEVHFQLRVRVLLIIAHLGAYSASPAIAVSRVTSVGNDRQKDPKASVLMILYQYSPADDGGAERQARQLAEELVRRGRRVGVVAPRHPGLPAHSIEGGVEVHRIWAMSKPRVSVTFLPNLARFLITHGRSFQIWHAHQAYYHAVVALSLAPLMRKCCVVKAAASGAYGDIARLRKSWMRRWVMNRLSRADAFISLNADLTSELSAAGVLHERISGIPNSVDCARFRPPSVEEREVARSAFKIAPDATVVMFAGRLTQDKGVDFLLDAWRSVEARSLVPGCQLLVVGDGRLAAEYRSRASKELRYASFLGRVPDIRTLLHAADALVHPSLSEGTSNIVLEAMATGLPVIGTRIGGVAEQILDGVTGVLVPPKDARALANAIAALVADRSSWSSMGAAARRSVEQRYSLGPMVDAYESLYDRVASGGDKGPRAKR
jgi:glycosyltransferase involved in cell wall biosynthesis